MLVCLAAMALLILTGFVALFVESNRAAMNLAAAGVIASSAAIVTIALGLLITGTDGEVLKLPWSVPFGSFYVALDSLSAVFMIPICLLSALAAVYGSSYMQSHSARRLGTPAFFYNVLIAAMLMVVLARNGVLFLVAWEIMSLASYFLVTFEHEQKHVRQAGWTYLIATHIGTAFLLACFTLIARWCGSLDFDSIAGLKGLPIPAASVLFLLALIGFGTKAGIMPLHVWLPEAHPAAPSHVSAVMSGVMIKTGIYGIMRTLAFLPSPPAWWAWLLIGIGAISGILGVLLALAQHDLKRLLAYHSVENIGIIILGIGLGVLGNALHMPVLAVMGFAGALLHVFNHALFKGLLFLCAGSVVHATGTREIDELGGLGKLMPATAATFLVGAIAISGLPPLNGFISEFLIYLGSFNAGIWDGLRSIVPAITIIASLALIGGLALACFTKAFGIIFLGEPRSSHAKHGHEAGPLMCVPMWILAALCIAVGLGGPFAISPLERAVSQLSPQEGNAVASELRGANAILVSITMASVIFAALVVMLIIFRRRLFAGRTVTKQPTWDCGYIRPTARMQYTASSFAQPIVDMFKSILGSRRKGVRIRDIFPAQAAFESSTPDMSKEYIYRPTFLWIDWVMGKMRWVQYGSVQLYVLYIAVTLIILLVWKLR